MKKVTAVQLDDRGLVTLATLDNGSVMELKDIIYNAKLGKLKGVQIAHDPISHEELVVASKELTNAAL